MEAEEAQTQTPPGTRIGGVSLVTGDGARLATFYERALGLRVLAQNAAGRHLGPPGGTPWLTLAERPGARPPAGRATGLYHLAVLLPTRRDLASAFSHMVGTGAPFSGFADHLVSEALYLNDPDGNGIEVYRDRPRSEWAWNGTSVAMAVDPLDAQGLLAEAGSEPWRGMPAGTTLGHVHLRVADLAPAERFYHGLLGFDVTARLPGALFVSAGGYHHHLGLNTWQSRGAAPPPPDAAGLGGVTILLPHPEDLRAVQSRLRSAQWPFTEAEDGLHLSDPAGNALHLRAEYGETPVTDVTAGSGL